MNEILQESDFQDYIIQYLEANNGYEVRLAKDFDRFFAVDRDMLFKFLDSSQPKTMEKLRKIYKEDVENTIINVINNACDGDNGSLVEVFKSGIELSNFHLDLMYTKPATTFNNTLNRLYATNIFSVMKEVQASDNERIDLVIFLNGLAIISFELKCNISGQDYHDAILQYRKDRSPKTRLFRFKSGCIVNFAMDLNEVYMTTRLNKDATYFMPFNMGKGEGIDSGAGNPLFTDKYSVSYMWEDILTKDTILSLISKFIFIERKKSVDEDTGEKIKSQTQIFPRYHQLDLVRKVLDSVYEHGSNLNYLIEHSPGSGKTNSIAWLTYRLASIHDKDNKIIFDNVIVVSDRVVVDRQLQQAIKSMDHQAGFIKVLDDGCTSADLAEALNHNTKIIATTIQKFPYIVDTVAHLKNKRFAVIIDEAHSSTSGKDMQAITMTLGSDDNEYVDADDMITSELERSGKQPNVSIFAFTATPKNKTLRLFGQLNAKGHYQAFHLYSMKQAIEEGFILDPLQNFTQYKTMFEINKSIEDDPNMKVDDAKRQITKFIELHDPNIVQRIEIIIEHFKNVVMNELNGMAKAMVITPSRQAAVKYRQAFDDYIHKKGYSNIKALVAFSGKVKLEEDTEYTEVLMNGIAENKLPYAFDTDSYNVLIVANKYQTGFDQKKLCAMYVMKKLKGVNAVQTYSRLNRICPPLDKKTFILDFVNDYESVKNAFAPFYTVTLLSGNLNPKHIYDIEVKIDGYAILDPFDIDNFNDLLFKNRTNNINPKDQLKINFCLQKAQKNISSLSKEDQKDVRMLLNSFVRFYEFLIQASCFKDIEIHKKYNFIKYLVSYLSSSSAGAGFDLKGKLKATNIEQQMIRNHIDEKLVSKPIVKLPELDRFNLGEAKFARLSQIIDEINSRTGKSYDNNVAIKSVLQIKDILLKSDTLKKAAKSNSEQDFEFSFYDSIDSALIESLDHNQDFFTLLLNNEEFKKETLDVFKTDIYEAMRNA